MCHEPFVGSGSEALPSMGMIYGLEERRTQRRLTCSVARVFGEVWRKWRGLREFRGLTEFVYVQFFRSAYRT
jgi:hypothetical protein